MCNGYLPEYDVCSPGPFQGPLAVGQGVVLAVDKVGRFEDVSGGHLMELALLGAGDLVGVVAAVVLAVTNMLARDALPVRAVEGTCKKNA